MNLCRHKTYVFKVRDVTKDPPEGHIEINAPDEWEAMKVIAILSPGIQVVELVMAFYPDEQAKA